MNNNDISSPKVLPVHELIEYAKKAIQGRDIEVLKSNEDEDAIYLVGLDISNADCFTKEQIDEVLNEEIDHGDPDHDFENIDY